MSITLTFTADTIEAAYDQMREALRGHRHVAPEPKAPDPELDYPSLVEDRTLDYPSLVEDRTEPEYVEVPIPSGNATAEAVARRCRDGV